MRRDLCSTPRTRGTARQNKPALEMQAFPERILHPRVAANLNQPARFIEAAAPRNLVNLKTGKVLGEDED